MKDIECEDPNCPGCQEDAARESAVRPTMPRLVVVNWANPLAEEEDEACPDTLPDFGDGEDIASAEERRIEALIDEDTDFSGDGPDSDRYLESSDLEDY